MWHENYQFGMSLPVLRCFASAKFECMQAAHLCNIARSNTQSSLVSHTQAVTHKHVSDVHTLVRACRSIYAHRNSFWSAMCGAFSAVSQLQRLSISSVLAFVFSFAGAIL